MASLTGYLSKGFDLAAAVGTLEVTRRTDRGVDREYLVLGFSLGMAYRILEGEYVGRFRKHPLRYLTVLSLWLAITRAVLPMDDESGSYSVGSGVGIGSLVYSIVDQKRKS
ncbi:hypothetical protein [Haloterrigena salifodinae]|uniref:hypothetical protein n=1 Tax=Haloterrigena salifodinae TaxID=2675099 RepID=UPI000F88E2D2|nr:hypothetical protein [Haloterrigena salifodinae]